MNESSPSVSIILPTFNRAEFLAAALESISSQSFADWELIVVDDGSTDRTRDIIDAVKNEIDQPLTYVYQGNQGAYGARNTGLDHASGRYVAFFDSDDTWLPHHLNDCVRALDEHEDVDWVFGACSIHDMHSGKQLADTTFSVDGQPRPFRKLRCERRDALHVITDPTAARCQLLHGLYSGLQNSVIRAGIFDSYRFEARLRNEAEDQVAVVRALLAGYRFAYFDQVHVAYYVHADNSSAVGTGGGTEKKLRVVRAMIAGFESLLSSPQMPGSVRQALRRRLGREYFWNLGYSLLWQTGHREEAKAMFRRGLQFWPWDWRCWKTYVNKQLIYRSSGPGSFLSE